MQQDPLYKEGTTPLGIFPEPMDPIADDRYRPSFDVPDLTKFKRQQPSPWFLEKENYGMLNRSLRKERIPSEEVLAVQKRGGPEFVDSVNYLDHTKYQVVKRTAQGSPRRLRTRTPRRRRFVKLPFEVYLCNAATGWEEQSIRVMMRQESTVTERRKIPPPVMLDEIEKQKILSRIPNVKAENVNLDSVILTKERILEFKGKRSEFPSQIEVMGESAQKYVAAIVPHLAITQEYHWCHLYAFAFGGTKADGPQVKRNLVAGTKNCNYLMLAFEREIMLHILKGLLPSLKITATASLLKPSKLEGYSRIAEKINYYLTKDTKEYIKVVFFGTNIMGYNTTLNRYAQGLVDHVLSAFRGPDILI